MKLLDENTNTEYYFVWSRDGRIMVDICILDCNRRFSNIAEILEPQSLNPLFRFPKPLGRNAIKFIMGNYLRIIADTKVMHDDPDDWPVGR